jgi:hypothetical protein
VDKQTSDHTEEAESSGPVVERYLKYVRQRKEMRADDNGDLNRNPEPETVVGKQRRAERDQASFDSKDDSEELASPLSLDCRGRIVNVGNFLRGHESRDAQDQQNDSRYDA